MPGSTVSKGLPRLDEGEIAKLVALSSLVASARSAVERDSYKREIDLVLDTELPARVAQSLRQLYAGMLAIGLDRATAWPLVAKTGLDSIPKVRRAIFDRRATKIRRGVRHAMASGFGSCHG